MMVFRVPVHVIPRAGLLDPQGSAVAGALRTLGFAAVKDVHVGRFIVVELQAADETEAARAVSSMCDKLLANPVVEDFRLGEVQRA